MAYIASAIKDAENAALDRAAEVAEAAQAEADSCSSHVVEEAIVSAAVSECSGIIAQSIRSLKHPKD